MSRTSRRVSRPLIGALAGVIVLGVFFTIHKLHKAHAADASKEAPVALVSDPAPQPPAPVVAPKPQVSAPAAPPIAIPPTALVTQTPTEKLAQDPAPVSQPQAAVTTPGVVTAAESPAPADQSENDTAGLEQWAHGTKPVASDTTSAAHDAMPPVQTDLSAQPLVDVKAKMDAGDLLGARQILNQMLISGRASDPDAIKKQIEDINQTVIFSARKFPNDPWGGTYQVAGGERLSTIAARNGVTWEFLSRVNGVTPRRLRSGQTIKIFKGPFYAIVYKHLFKMEIYLGAPGGRGSLYIRSFPVGLGKDNSTPTGLWICKAGDKIRHPRYYPPHGGDVISADDPKNPLGGYWIAIQGLQGQAVGQESFGIHGTIDPDSVGKMESMGCIRLRADDISWVFDLLVDGKSKVLVKD